MEVSWVSLTHIYFLAACWAFLKFFCVSLVVKHLSMPYVLEVDVSSFCIWRNVLSSSFFMARRASFVEIAYSSFRLALRQTVPFRRTILVVYFAQLFLLQSLRTGLESEPLPRAPDG